MITLIILFLKLILVLFSIVSIGVFFTRKFNIKLEFGVLLSTTSIISILYLFSLIKLLLLSAVILFLIGTFLGIYYLYVYLVKHKYDLSIFKESKVSLTFAFILIVFLFFLLFKLVPVHFDNFSHWLVISKQTILLNNLPDASNIMTSYFEYPPGSTYFIYYCCYILGNSEFCMFISQTILEILLLLPLFSFLKDKKSIILNSIVMIFIVFCLVIDISVIDLLVDSLLGIMAFASFAFLYMYKRDLRKTLLLMIPINLSLLLMKNSAIFFFAIEILYILYLLLKNKSSFKVKIINFFIAIIPFVLFVFWKIRCKIIFSDVGHGAQAVSLTNYMTNAAEKTLGDIKNIGINFIKNLIDLNNLYLIIILLVLSGIIIYYFINRSNEQIKNLFKGVSLVLFVYLAYSMSLLFAYIFSMTLDEALRLASFDRYIYSVVIFIVGMAIVFYINNKNNSKILSTFIIISLIFVIFSCKNTLILMGIQDYNSTKRYSIEQNLKHFPVDDAKNVLVISTETKVDGYVRFVISYLLNTNKYTLINETSKLSEIDVTDYAYVITLDKDENVKNFLDGHSSYSGKTGWYKIQ